MRLFAAAAPSAVLCLALTGCSITPTAAPTPEQAPAIQGKVHGGQQPIVGSHVYLFAANTTGYGGNGIAPSPTNASISLLNAASTGQSDSIGAYVLTAADGSFSITNDYACASGQQVYLYALGGNPGAGTNSAAGLMAVLGNCPSSGNFLTTTPFVWINEVSTVAAAYSFAGFATDATHISSSGTALAQTGIANAFAMVTNLVTRPTGVARPPFSTSGNVSRPAINTLANILAACVNSTGPTSTTCITLFSNSRSGGSSGTLATDTASAAINIAHNPGANVAALFGISTPAQAFSPTLTVQPNDFTVALRYVTNRGNAPNTSIAIDATGNAWIVNPAGSSVTEFAIANLQSFAGTSFTAPTLAVPQSLAIDPTGNIWVTDGANAAVTEFSNSGALLSGTNGYTAATLTSRGYVSIDGLGNAWISGFGNNAITKLSPSGTVLSGPSGYTSPGLTNPVVAAFDSSGDAWAVTFDNTTALFEISPSGATLSGTNGFNPGGLLNPDAIAFDASGDAWVTGDYGSLVKLSSTGATLSGSNGYTVAGLMGSSDIVIDGAGNVWIANGSLFELSNAATVLSGTAGYNASLPNGINVMAVDGSGNIWLEDDSQYVTELVGIAAPVVTPLAAGITSRQLGARP